MAMTAGLRKLALTVHITSSVAWLGSVAAFLALSVSGLRTNDGATARAAYLGMDLITSWVIVPLSLASLVTGLVSSLGTSWGLFRHYWVVVKLLLTLVATLLLLLHARPISHIAALARGSDDVWATLGGDEFLRLRIQLVADASAAVVVLLFNTTLGVFKPWGLTSYGRRKRAEGLSSTAGPPRAPAETGPTPSGGRYLLLAIIAALVAVVVLHLAGGGLGSPAPSLTR